MNKVTRTNRSRCLKNTGDRNEGEEKGKFKAAE